MCQEIKTIRNHRIPPNSCTEGDIEQKKFHLVCIFPEKTSDVETVKNDVRSILSMELQHQLQQRG